MPTIKRKSLPDQFVGYVVTIPIIVERGGSRVHLTEESLVSVITATDPAGNNITPTGTARTDQTGDNEGRFDVTITAAQMTTGGAGSWKIDAFLGVSSSPETLYEGQFTFQAYAKETS